MPSGNTSNQATASPPKWASTHKTNQNKFEDPEILFEIALKFLTVRDRSEKEVREYLERKQGLTSEKTTIDGVIEKLKELNLLDDQNFTLMYTNSQLNRGKGQLFIKLKLKYFGINQILIDQTIKQIDDKDWVLAAIKQLSKKHIQFNKMNSWQVRQKTSAYLYQRGYNSSTINAVIDEIGNKGLK